MIGSFCRPPFFMSKMRCIMALIYIVEDDNSIRDLESYALQNINYEVCGFEKGAELYPALEARMPDLIILDIMLPEEDGISILKRLRKNTATVALPIMVVTAKDAEMDAVRALDNGADDYVTKPFGVMEFLSRVKALLRRSEGKTSAHKWVYDQLVLDDEKHRVTVDGENVELTFKEYELLKYLLINKGIVLSRDKIMDTIWGYNFESESRTVDAHIQTLRKKLGKMGSAIITVRNVGYKLGE